MNKKTNAEITNLGNQLLRKKYKYENFISLPSRGKRMRTEKVQHRIGIDKQMLLFANGCHYHKGEN